VRRSPARRALAVGAWGAGWAAGWWLGWRLPPLPAPAEVPPEVPALARPGARATPRVAVVVPARNEERTLGALLASLAEQSRPASEVVVVDDGSTDATAEVARAHGARVVEAGPLPPGWVGKPWACHRGVAATSADTVVLLDADVTLGPEALAALVAEHDRRGGLVSVLPHHEPVAGYEQWSAPCNLVSAMGTGAATPGSGGAADGAFGPCLVTRRATLEAVGGFAAVAGDVVEDLALARRYQHAGLPVAALAGGDHVAFRMYPDGPAQLVEGWTKNLAAGAGAVPAWRSALVALWVAIGLAGPLSALRRRDRRSLALAVAAWMASAVQLHVLVGRLGRFRWWVGPASPALLAGFSALVGRSALARRRGHATWRGRQVPVGAPPASGRGAPSGEAPPRRSGGLGALARLAILVMRARL
jgi:4,4'-diaponeurosporenoate glycosyltransferase